MTKYKEEDLFLKDKGYVFLPESKINGRLLFGDAEKIVWQFYNKKTIIKILQWKIWNLIMPVRYEWLEEGKND